MTGIFDKGGFVDIVGQRTGNATLAQAYGEAPTPTPAAPALTPPASLLAAATPATTPAPKPADDDAVKRTAIAQNTVIGSSAGGDRLGGS